MCFFCPLRIWDLIDDWSKWFVEFGRGLGVVGATVLWFYSDLYG